MSGSDSDVSRTCGPLPRSSVIEGTLRDVVREYQDSAKAVELTVNNVRSAVVTRLGLEEDFFKTAQWKGKSKAVIWDEVAKETVSEDDQPAQRKVEEGETSEKNQFLNSAQSKPRKRKTSEPPKHPDSDSDQSRMSEEREDGKDVILDARSDEESHPPDITNKDFERYRLSGSGDASESELSVLIDEDPAPKKPPGKKRSRSASDSTSQKARNLKARKNATVKKTEAAATIDPDKEEIKRLQGWLVKCGIRKLWGKELAPYESNKAKIQHLKEMLSSVGMTGRYSQDKARQIKEQRELAADLEAVQEGNKLWGTQTDDGSGDLHHSDGGGGGGRRRRPLAKGLQELDFISDEGSD